MRTHAMSIGEFMSGEYKQSKKKVRKKWDKKQVMTAGTAILPLAAIPHITGYAHAPEAVPVIGTGESYISGKTMEIIAHSLDPIVDLLVAFSLPVASVIMIGGAFFFMWDSNRAWDIISKGAMGYILIQISPVFIKVLGEIGRAMQ
jgi:hypothetical protein